MSQMSYDELEASACDIYSYEPGVDGRSILRALPDPSAMESRRISTPKLWTTPYTSRFRERFTPTPSCSSDDDAAYETSPEDAKSDYEDCLPVPPKSELRNGGLGLPYNKHREVQIINNVFRGDEDIDGVAADIDLSLIDGSCPIFGSHRNAGLPPVPTKHRQRPTSMQGDPRVRQDSSFTMAPLIPKWHSSHIDTSSNETLVADLGSGVARSSPKSVTPPEYYEQDPVRHSFAAADAARYVGFTSARSEVPAESFSEGDADDEADGAYTGRSSWACLQDDEIRRLSSAARQYQLQQASHKSCKALHDFVDGFVHCDPIDGQRVDPKQRKNSGNFEAACALQRGKQSLDDRYLMDLMHVHPAVRISAFKRDLRVPHEAAPTATSEEQEKRKLAYRYKTLNHLEGAGR